MTIDWSKDKLFSLPLKVALPNPAAPLKVAPSNLALPLKVALPNLASSLKVAPSNPATPVKVAPSNVALPLKVAPSKLALPLKVASPNQAMPVKVAPSNLALPLKVAPPNPALSLKVAPPNPALPLKVAPSNVASPLKVAPPNLASPLKVAPLNPATPVKVAPSNLASPAEGRPVEPGVAAEGRPAEIGAAAEGRPGEVGVSHYAVYEVEVDEGGAGEIEADARPETWARRIGGALIFGPVITQMLGKNTLRGKTYLSFLLPCVANLVESSLQSRAAFQIFGDLAVRLSGWRRGGERHAQVGADDVDNDLATFRPVLGEAFEGVQRAEPNRGLFVAELLHGLGIKLSFIGAVLFLPVLLIGAVLLHPVLLIGAVSDDQPAGHGEPGEGLHQCGADIIPCFEFVRGAESFRGRSDEQRRCHHEHEHEYEHADERCPGECPEPCWGIRFRRSSTISSPCGHGLRRT